jgi:hypothetical protein
VYFSLDMPQNARQHQRRLRRTKAHGRVVAYLARHTTVSKMCHHIGHPPNLRQHGVGGAVSVCLSLQNDSGGGIGLTRFWVSMLT